MMAYFRITKVRNLLIISSIFIIILIITITRERLVDDVDRKHRLESIDDFIKNKASALACKQPHLPIHSPEMMKFVQEVPPLVCDKNGMDWVKCEGFECRIRDQIKIMYGPVKCSFTDLIRVNDFELIEDETTHSDSFYKLQKSDTVKVQCKSVEHKWSGILTGIRFDKELWESTTWDKTPEKSLKLSVLIFGFDSVSRNSFIRKLPNSYEYLTKKMGAIVLEGYNIVGDGTPQALIPILTGKTELELPDTRKRIPNTAYVNSYPFIWNDFKKAGYVTGYYEDCPSIGTFTYRLNGFDQEPTDHYMHNYYLAVMQAGHKYSKYCIGDTSSHNMMLDQTKNLYKVYKNKPKFLFAFHGELSHDDYNMVGAADDDVTNFLTEMNESGALNDTLLIFMADHGHRFAQIRNTVQGKQEERLPFFSFVFPDWFKKTRPDLYGNFRWNTDKLTTPFDIHATLKDVLQMESPEVGDLNRRSISLFSRIPAARSCAHARIEPHWCACLDWENLSTTSDFARRLADTFISALNNYTNEFRQRCDLLSISNIEWVTKVKPNENLLKFNKNADIDGFVPDLSSDMKIDYDVYQIKIVVIPGNSIFEASITYLKSNDRFEINMRDISRVNMYGSQARCIENIQPDLRKYCYCKD